MKKDTAYLPNDIALCYLTHEGVNFFYKNVDGNTRFYKHVDIKVPKHYRFCSINGFLVMTAATVQIFITAFNWLEKNNNNIEFIIVLLLIMTFFGWIIMFYNDLPYKFIAFLIRDKYVDAKQYEFIFSISGSITDPNVSMEDNKAKFIAAYDVWQTTINREKEIKEGKLISEN